MLQKFNFFVNVVASGERIFISLIYNSNQLYIVLAQSPHPFFDRRMRICKHDCIGWLIDLVVCCGLRSILPSNWESEIYRWYLQMWALQSLSVDIVNSWEFPTAEIVYYKDGWYRSVDWLRSRREVRPPRIQCVEGSNFSSSRPGLVVAGRR